MRQRFVFNLLLHSLTPISLTRSLTTTRVVTGGHRACCTKSSTSQTCIPVSTHFGTTGLGQDMFAQIVYGARITLLIGFVAAIGSTALQVLFGLNSAYFGGLIDEVLSLVINVFLVLPGLPLAIVLASLASASGASKNEFVIALVLLFTSWSYGARVRRAQTLSLKEREFVAAAPACKYSSCGAVGHRN